MGSSAHSGHLAFGRRWLDLHHCERDLGYVARRHCHVLSRLVARLESSEDPVRSTRLAHQIACEIGDRHVEGSELGNLGGVLLRQGRVEEARAALLSAEATLRAIVRALRDASLRQHFGTAGLARVKARFTVERMVEQTAAVYARVGGRHHAEDTAYPPVRG